MVQFLKKLLGRPKRRGPSEVSSFMVGQFADRSECLRLAQYDKVDDKAACDACNTFFKDKFGFHYACSSERELGGPDVLTFSYRSFYTMTNAIMAVRMDSPKAFWHELADFVHGYELCRYVGVQEAMVFGALYAVGKQLFSENVSGTEQNTESLSDIVVDQL